MDSCIVVSDVQLRMPEGEIRFLSVVVPCLNEHANIDRYPAELFAFFGGYPFKTEYIFVDDGSTDKTAEKLAELNRLFERVYVIRHPSNLGLGQAVRNGFLECHGDAVLTLDADLTFHPREFPKMLKEYRESTDCVSGAAIGDFDGVPFSRRVLSVSVNLFYRFLLGRPVNSMSSLFRLYRQSALAKLNLRSRWFDINAEVLGKLILSNKNVVDVPVRLTGRMYGESKIRIVREIYNHVRMFISILLWRVRGFQIL